MTSTHAKKSKCFDTSNKLLNYKEANRKLWIGFHSATNVTSRERYYERRWNYNTTRNNVEYSETQLVSPP